MDNFAGYDISPDMVRLSRANMYLHGFPQPRIHEYDTLTSEERWDERYDVIMANPPFMTPKGGIRPHNRFSIKASRSEVLFVDYIAEHLNVNGRAGVIVPEGIIFQGGNAYKTLRRMLVENYLWCVVSLPAGVFNPYSGVKTCILFMDKTLAKRTDEILFVNIENDGFGLGAQRRALESNDLPRALKAIQNRKTNREGAKSSLTHVVSCKRILESADINLSGERYRDNNAKVTGRWPMVKLGEQRFFRLESGGTPSSTNSEFWEDGNICWTTLVDLPQDNLITELFDTRRKITQKGLRESSATLLPPNSVLVSSRATIGRIAITKVSTSTNQGFKNIVISDFSKVDARYLAYAVTQLVPRMIVMASGGTFKEISKTSFSNLEIPLPPLPEQQMLVAELNGYRKIIEGAKQVIANYKPSIAIDPLWPKTKLGDVAEFKNGVNYSAKNKGEGMRVIGVGHFKNKLKSDGENLDQINPKDIVGHKDLLLDGDILFVRSNGNKALVGRSLVVRTLGHKVTHSAFTIRLRFTSKEVEPLFFGYIFKSPECRAALTGRGANISNLTQEMLQAIEVPLPPRPIQGRIVETMEEEAAMIDANRKLVELYQKKIQHKLTEIWGKEAE